MKILVTGGAGYIGSHICLQLLQKEYQIIVVDNLSNSDLGGLTRIQEKTKQIFPIYKIDLRNTKALEKVFNEHGSISAVIHLAGFKSVKESVNNPLEYYDNNIGATISLLKVMQKYNCRSLIFSSSATVYGQPKKIPVNENAPTVAKSPYGQTKLIIEKLLKNLIIDQRWNIISLRYFNPIGAHSSGILVEEPKGVPENLVPYLLQVAFGKREKLTVFGGDYPTKDGTAIRDYIHILDLANGHLKALEYLEKIKDSQKDYQNYQVFNLGTGKGYSVLEVIQCFKSLGIVVNYEIGVRRPGDVAVVYADITKAKEILGWTPNYVLGDMCKDAWLSYKRRNK